MVRYLGPGSLIWVIPVQNTELRRIILRNLAARKSATLPPSSDDFDQAGEFDRLADLVRTNLDMDSLYSIVGVSDC